MEARGDVENKTIKGRVCVTGGTGFVASWLIMKLLRHGYSVNTTVRLRSPSQGGKKDVSFLTDLPNAPDRLSIFHADLGDPASFKPAIEGCVGVFHVAHPSPNLVTDESEEILTDECVKGIIGILQACLDSGSVKRVVYTSSAATVLFNDKGRHGVVLDESSWSDVDYMRKMKFPLAPHYISKTKTEMAALDFAKKHNMDLITVIPSLINGSFICPNLPDSVRGSLALIIGYDKEFRFMKRNPLVHVDDVAEAHIHLFEYQGAKGRFICTAVEATIEELFKLLSSRHPEFQLQNIEVITNELASMSSKKLVETGFNYKYGIEKMFDDAIRSCKLKGIL